MSILASPPTLILSGFIQFINTNAHDTNVRSIEINSNLDNGYKSGIISAGATINMTIGVSKTAIIYAFRSAGTFANSYLVDSFGGIQPLSVSNSGNTTISISNNVVSIKNNTAVSIQYISMTR